jgi:hypothetical protein
MDQGRAWDDVALWAALEVYRANLRERGLSPITVESDIRYCGLLLRWRIGEYVPKRLPRPTRRPVQPGSRSLPELESDRAHYEQVLMRGVIPSAVATYAGPPRRFLRWLSDQMGSETVADPAYAPSLGPARALPRRRVHLDELFLEIGAGHRDAIIRTTARMTALPSVTRVFADGTAAALRDVLARLPYDELPSLTDGLDYRTWFEAALQDVGATILRLNPPERRRSVQPGFKWGHGAKVLSLLVRNLVLCSRYFDDETTRRLEPWLYCPIDGIVMQSLRAAGIDPGVTRINQIGEADFWRIQDMLLAAASRAGVPVVWFDDVWSENRRRG